MKKIIISSLLVFSSLFSFAQFDTTSTGTNFLNYNSLDGYKIEYPDFLIKQKSTELHRTNFKSKNGEVTLTLDSFNPGEYSLSDYYGDYNQAANLKIEYRVMKDDWYVVSGTNTDNGKVFYIKSYMSYSRGKQIRTMKLEYPQWQKTDFDSIISEMVKSFKDY